MNRRNFIKTIGSGIITSTLPSFGLEGESLIKDFLKEDDEPQKIEIATISKQMEELDFPILHKERNNISREHFYLDFVNVHTGEKLSLDLANPSRVHYFNELKKFAYFMRDYRTGSVRGIDSNLLNILQNIKVKTGTNKPFLVLSGYRTKKTNDMLRRTGHKAAKHSLHIKGKAIDIALQDTGVRKIASIARGLRMGGVGEYDNNHFVHVDTGRVRHWYG